jgi:hypothetical protein
MKMLDPANVVIEDRDLKRILTAVGGPVLSFEDLEVKRDDVIDLCVLPALEVHFSYFPIEFVQEVSLAGAISVAFPDPDLTLGVSSAQISMDIGAPNNPSLSPFVNDRNYQRGGLMRQGQYDIEAIGGNLMARSAMQSAVNLLAAKHVHVDPVTKTLTGFTNAPGICRISWAMMSLNANDIPVVHKPRFITLCQANLLEVIGTIRGSVSLSDDVSMDGQAMIDRAEKIRNDAMEVIYATTRGVIVRG